MDKCMLIDSVKDTGSQRRFVTRNVRSGACSPAHLICWCFHLGLWFLLTWISPHLLVRFKLAEAQLHQSKVILASVWENVIKRSNEQWQSGWVCAACRHITGGTAPWDPQTMCRPRRLRPSSGIKVFLTLCSMNKHFHSAVSYFYFIKRPSRRSNFSTGQQSYFFSLICYILTCGLIQIFLDGLFLSY